MAVSQPPPPGRKEPGHVREDVLGELEGGRLVRADGGNHRGSDGFDSDFNGGFFSLEGGHMGVFTIKNDHQIVDFGTLWMMQFLEWNHEIGEVR